MGGKLGKNNTYIVSGDGGQQVARVHSSKVDDDDDRRTSDGSMNFSGPGLADFV